MTLYDVKGFLESRGIKVRCAENVCPSVEETEQVSQSDFRDKLPKKGWHYYSPKGWLCPKCSKKFK